MEGFIAQPVTENAAARVDAKGRRIVSNDQRAVDTRR